MEHVTNNHRLNGRKHTPQCVISVLCVFAKSVQNQPICWALCGLKRMHPDVQVMRQACQFTAIHPQARWSKPAAMISSVSGDTHHNESFLPSAFCQIFPEPAHLLGAMGPERDASSHADCVSSLLIYCHVPTRHMERVSTNHQLHGQRCTP